MTHRPPITIALLAALTLVGCSSPSPSQDSQTESAGSSAASTASAEEPPAPRSIDITDELEAIEEKYGASLGVSVLDTGSGDRLDYMEDERFGYASTVKTFIAARFLQTVPEEQRKEHVTWTNKDVEEAGHAPVTEAQLKNGLTLNELAEASMRQSDNAATNVVLKKIGGPAGLAESLEAWGDTTTKPVNYEPTLNTIERGSTDDTTTPAAFTQTLAAVLGLPTSSNTQPGATDSGSTTPAPTGAALDSADREQLIDWMSNNDTGESLIRAGAPEGWTVADKSGGAQRLRNDLAIVTPPGREPILITIFTTTEKKVDQDRAEEIVRETASAALAEFE